MAYQPILGPIIGHVSELSTGSTPVTLASAGTFYVVTALRLITPAPSGFFTIPLTDSSLMTAGKKSVEFMVLFNASVTGDALVYSQLDPLSVLEGAVGNGTQVATGGIPGGIGRFVPGNSETPLAQGARLSPLADAFPHGAVAYLVAAPNANNASVYASTSLTEIPVDAASNGNPLARGVQLGS